MKKGEIKVIVAGQSNIGKSTVIQLLAEALEKYNIEHSIISDTQGTATFTDFQEQRLQKVAEKATVVIEERPLRQNISHNFESYDLGEKES